MQEAVDDVRSAVTKVRTDLPSDLRDPIVNKLDLAGSPILAFTVRSEQRDDEALSWFVEDTVAKRLLAVNGVGAVTRVGGVSREVTIALDPVKLQALGRPRPIFPANYARCNAKAPVAVPIWVAANNRCARWPTYCRWTKCGRCNSLADGRHIRLDQVASIEDSVAERRAAAFLDGKPVVGFEVTRSRGAGEVEVGAGVKKR